MTPLASLANGVCGDAYGVSQTPGKTPLRRRFASLAN